MNRRDPLQFIMLALLIVVAAISWTRAEYFGHEIIAEVAIFAIFVMSLDVLVGYTGLVSLGHAAFLAMGAYVMGGCTVLLGWSPGLSLAMAVVGAALGAGIVGAFVIRLTGVFFIMITLAAGQMVFAYLFKARAFGANDGMSGTPRLSLEAFGLDVDEPKVFSAALLLLALGVYIILRVLMRSVFGATLAGIHANEQRMRALGCPTGLYKLSAFIVAGAVAGFAGALLAMHTGFISPDLAFWTVSGEALIMVIVGGLGSLVGPALGAGVLITLRHALVDVTDYWMLVMGLFFIVVVVFAPTGLYGLANSAFSRLTNRAGRDA